MSKPVKNLITKSYQTRLADIDGAVLIDIRGVKSNLANQLRSGLAKNQIKVRVVKNSLARRAVSGTALEKLTDMLKGPSALVYGGDSVVGVARQLVDLAKEIPDLEFKGAIMDGEVYTADQIPALSKFPTKVEAQAQIIQIILGPAGQAIGAITSAGSQIAGIVEALEKKLEEGEAAAKVA